MRVPSVAVRKHAGKMTGELRYHDYITTRTDVGAIDVVRKAHRRRNQENFITQFKCGVDAMRVLRLGQQMIATLARNPKGRFAMMAHQIKARRR